MNDNTSPQISVVLICRDDYASIRKAMTHLQAQTLADKMEVLIITPAVETFHLEESVRERFHQVHTIAVGPITTMAGHKAAAVRRASAPVVAFSEDHAFPSPEWAEKVIKIIREDWAAVGPAMRNANPSNLVSWVDFYMNVGPWIEPVQRGSVGGIPWHVSTYNRGLLLDLGPELDRLLEPECLLQWKLLAEGHHLYLEPEVYVYHTNHSLVFPWMALRVPFGRLYAAARALEWPFPKRLIFALATPLIPIVRLRRTIRNIVDSGQRGRLLPTIIPLLTIALVLDGVGQFLGYILGFGDAMRHYYHSEINRIEYLIPQDVEMLTSNGEWQDFNGEGYKP